MGEWVGLGLGMVELSKPQCFLAAERYVYEFRDGGVCIRPWSHFGRLVPNHLIRKVRVAGVDRIQRGSKQESRGEGGGGGQSALETREGTIFHRRSTSMLSSMLCTSSVFPFSIPSETYSTIQNLSDISELKLITPFLLSILNVALKLAVSVFKPN